MKQIMFLDSHKSISLLFVSATFDNENHKNLLPLRSKRL